LTYETDRFPAIAGLAGRMKPILNCRYLAGLWEHELVHQLLWHRYGEARRTAIYQAPTWSWASIIGQVNFGFVQLSKEKCIAVQHIEVTNRDGNEMGQVITGYLRLKGALIPSSIMIDKDRLPATETHLYIEVRGFTYYFVPDTSEELDEKFTNERCFCAPCDYEEGFSSWMIGLVLKPSGKKGEYQRVGMFTNRYASSNDMRIGRRFFRLPKADHAEKALITKDFFEKYEENIDCYTFTII